MTIVLSTSNSASRASNGILYLRKRFIPSENHFYLGLYKSRDRLRCIELCQESSLCQTVIYDRIKQECTLFSEHTEYGSGRLYEENNESLVTIRLDKDSHNMIKNKQNQLLTISSSSYRKHDEGASCDNLCP